MRQLTFIIDDLAEAFGRLWGIADMVMLEMRALAHAADEMKVRAEALEYHDGAREPASAASGRRSEGVAQASSYFADGADLEYG